MLESVAVVLVMMRWGVLCMGLPKSPGKVIVSNVSEVDIAVAIFHAKSNVLPVIYCCPLKFHIGQPTTWSST